jgi:hypothetical protein
MRPCICILGAVLFVISAVARGESYLCIADHATGFKFDKQQQQWRQVNFNHQKSRYIIRPPTQEESKLAGEDASTEYRNPGYVALKGGGDRPHIFCNRFNQAGMLFCDGFGDKFVFGKSRLRYSRSNAWLGYVGADPVGSGSFFEEGKQDVYIEIGSCSPL